MYVLENITYLTINQCREEPILEPKLVSKIKKKRLCPLISVDNLENLCQYSFNYLINVMELKNNKSSVHISGTVEPRYNEVGYNKILL